MKFYKGICDRCEQESEILTKNFNNEMICGKCKRKELLDDRA